MLSEIKGLGFLFSVGVLLCIKNDDLVFTREDKAKVILVKKQTPQKINRNNTAGLGNTFRQSLTFLVQTHNDSMLP